MKRIPTILVMATMLTLIVSGLQGQDDDEGADAAGASPVVVADEKVSAEERALQQDPSYWMKKKLEFSQNVLVGLTKADFDLISENAEKMRALNRFESFIRRRSPAYRTQLRLFQHANDELIRTSDAKNIEGATLAFTQLTTSCVNCHKQLRDAGE